jgi:hypothetical protein
MERSSEAFRYKVEIVGEISGYASCANARAIEVLPVPGGPYNIVGGKPIKCF